MQIYKLVLMHVLTMIVCYQDEKYIIGYLHKLDDEIYKLVLMHVLTMIVCYQETYVIALKEVQIQKKNI
jgi:hypothetical protein